MVYSYKAIQCSSLSVEDLCFSFLIVIVPLLEKQKHTVMLESVCFFSERMNKCYFSLIAFPLSENLMITVIFIQK